MPLLLHSCFSPFSLIFKIRTMITFLTLFAPSALSPIASFLSSSVPYLCLVILTIITMIVILRIPPLFSLPLANRMFVSIISGRSCK